MASPVLYVGNKNYSSWSLRPWLALKWGGVPFEERVIPLGGEGYGRAEIKDVKAVSPSGRVPVLHIGDHVISDSLAIAEWAAEQTRALWPEDALVRAEARAAACEMHSGFAGLRRDMPMNIRRRLERTPDWAEDVRADLKRLFALWGGLRARYGDQGPFLFGQRCIADAMFAPVATRLRTYGVRAPDTAQAYCETIFADPAFKDWEAAAMAETWTIGVTEKFYT
jgi:glutathione S-transferase